MDSPDKEQVLRERIAETPVGTDRDLLIDELDATPIHYAPFYDRWLLVHDVKPFWDCWTDNGYDPSKSSFSRDVQILAAANYGKLDIENGGLHQFFHNHTGTFAPEMAEWLERAGLTDAAIVMRDAMAVFGPEFPRSPGVRQKFLNSFQGAERKEWDPFYQMDDRFYAATEGFDNAADRWLREVCGINRLRDRD